MSLSGVVLIWLDAPVLRSGFTTRGWLLVIVSLLCGMGSLIAVARRKFFQAVVASSGAVASVIWGWGISQYPIIVPPTVTSDLAKAPNNVLWAMILISAAGAVFLLPSLAYLFILFKRADHD